MSDITDPEIPTHEMIEALNAEAHELGGKRMVRWPTWVNRTTIILGLFAAAVTAGISFQAVGVLDVHWSWEPKDHAEAVYKHLDEVLVGVAKELEHLDTAYRRLDERVVVMDDKVDTLGAQLDDIKEIIEPTRSSRKGK